MNLDESSLSKIFRSARANHRPVIVRIAGIDVFQGVPEAIGDDYVAIPPVNAGHTKIIPFSAISFVEIP